MLQATHSHYRLRTSCLKRFHFIVNLSPNTHSRGDNPATEPAESIPIPIQGIQPFVVCYRVLTRFPLPYPDEGVRALNAACYINCVACFVFVV